MNLLACEIHCQDREGPGELYREIEERFGKAFYERIDVPASPGQKAALKSCLLNTLRQKSLQASQSLLS